VRVPSNRRYRIITSQVDTRYTDAIAGPYLLPFLAVKLNDPTDLASLGIVLFVIGFLYVNSNMIHTNPVLNIVGYHIFEIVDGNGKTAALISKRAYIRTGSEINAISVGDYVLLEKK